MEERSRPENDAWSRELDALSATMRTDLLASGISSENIEDQIAQAVARVQARRMNKELIELGGLPIEFECC